MDWVFYAIIANIFFAWSSILDKIVREKYVKNNIVNIMFVGLFSLFALIYIPFTGLEMPDLFFLLIILSIGIMYILGLIPYFKALSHEEASRIAPLWEFHIIFVLVFAIIFLNEILTTNGYIAFALLFAGGFLISIKPGKHIRISKAFALMILASLFLSIRILAIKYFTISINFWHIIILVNIGSFLATCILFSFKDHRTKFLDTVKTLKLRIGFVLGLKTFLAIVGMAFSIYALSLGPASLVSAIGSVHHFFVLAIAILLSKWIPAVLKEDTVIKVIFLKLVAISLIAVGVYMI